MLDSVVTGAAPELGLTNLVRDFSGDPRGGTRPNEAASRVRGVAEALGCSIFGPCQCPVQPGEPVLLVPRNTGSPGCTVHWHGPTIEPAFSTF